MGCGSGSTCWRRLVRWQRAGVWKRLHRVLLDRIAPAWPARSGARRGRQRLAPRAARGKKTGPNPTDRRKAGSKHHVLTDAHGIPLVATLTAANRHDITQLLPLVDAMPPLRRRARPARAEAAPGPRRPRLRFAAASRPTPRARHRLATRQTRTAPRQWPGADALGRRAHPGVAASLSPIGGAVRTPTLHSRSVSHVSVLARVLVLLETRDLISQRALRTKNEERRTRNEEQWGGSSFFVLRSSFLVGRSSRAPATLTSFTNSRLPEMAAPPRSRCRRRCRAAPARSPSARDGHDQLGIVFQRRTSCCPRG